MIRERPGASPAGTEEQPWHADTLPDVRASPTPAMLETLGNLGAWLGQCGGIRVRHSLGHGDWAPGASKAEVARLVTNTTRFPVTVTNQAG